MADPGSSLSNDKLILQFSGWVIYRAGNLFCQHIYFPFRALLALAVSAHTLRVKVVTTVLVRLSVQNQDTIRGPRLS